MKEILDILFIEEHPYNKWEFNSDKYEIRKRLLTRYERDSKGNQIHYELSNNLLIVARDIKYIKDYMEMVYDKLYSHKKIVVFALSVEMLMFDTPEVSYEEECAEWFRKKDIAVYSYSLNHPTYKYDLTLWNESYDWESNIVELHKNDLEFRFTKAEKRLGIHIRRKTKERQEIVNAIKHHINYNSKLFITLSEINSFLGENGLNEEQQKIITNQNIILSLNAPLIPKNNFYIELHGLTQRSMAELITETYNNECDTKFEKFTEKTLRPLISCKPFIHSDPYSFRLFSNMGFLEYTELYGDKLIQIFRNFSSPQKTDLKYIRNVVERINEIAEMSDEEWNTIYKKSLEKAVINKDRFYKIIPKWKNVDELF